MAITRFMEVMFSASENQDEELTSQVANDIEDAKNSEEGDGIETDEVTYVNLGSGKVLIIDNEKGEATVAEKSEDDPESYDLEGFESDEDLQKYLHTLDDGVTPDPEIETYVTEDHLEDHDLPNSEEWEDDLMTVEETAERGCCPDDEEEDEDEDEEEDEEEENTAESKVFSNPKLFCRIFSEVLEEEDPAIIGDLKIEKIDDDTLVVTDLSTGDDVQISENEDGEFEVSETQKELCYSVTMDEEELREFSEFLYGPQEYEVTMTDDELRFFADVIDEDEEEDDDDDEDEENENENYDDEEDDDVEEEEDEEDDEDEEDEDDEEEDDEDYEPKYVVGIDPDNHILVDAPVYTNKDADLLSDQLEEDGVENIKVFEDPEDAREYAIDLLGEAGVSDIEQIAEPKEHNFSDVTIYTTRYFSDVTEFMFKMFSEAEDDITDTQDVIEEAIQNRETQETDSEIITPVDDETAVVLDKDTDEYTKVTLDDGEIKTEKIDEEEADNLLDEAEENEEKEKKYSVLTNFFSDVIVEDVEAQEVPNKQGTVNPDEVDPETGDPINVEPSAAPAQPVEVVEDKALAAVQSIQEAANEAVLAITEAKEAPAPGEEEDLREAKFSMTSWRNRRSNDTLSNFFNNI